MRIEKKATLVSSAIALILVIMKMAVGFISGSVAILASAIDSLLDMVISAFNYFALHNAEKEPDERFNFGRRKLEPLAALIEGTIITFSALYILYQAINKLIEGTPIEHMETSIGVMVASLIITSGLVLFLNHVSSKTGNMVIAADALHYKTDLFSTAAVLLSLLVIAYTDYTFIDPILGIGIGIYMIYSAYPIIREGIMMLLDAALDNESVEKIHTILDREKDLNSYHDLRTRQSGSDIYISVHLVFSVSTSLLDAHLVGDRVAAALRALFPENTVLTLIHLDPYDDSNKTLHD